MAQRRRGETRVKRSEINDIIRAGGRLHPLVRLRAAAVRLLVAGRDAGAARRDRRHRRRAARLGHHRLRPGQVRRDGAVPVHRAQRLGGGPAARRRHVLRREDHDLAPGPAVADAPPHREGRGHHQPRRRRRWRSKLYNSDADGRRSTRRPRSTVATDGVLRSQAAGAILHLEPGRERHAAARQLARLLGRGRRRADRRGLDRQQRPDRQHLRRADRPLRRDRGGRGRRCTCWSRTTRRWLA